MQFNLLSFLLALFIGFFIIYTRSQQVNIVIKDECYKYYKKPISCHGKFR